jgi:hypothetical protein
MKLQQCVHFFSKREKRGRMTKADINMDGQKKNKNLTKEIRNILL